VSQHPASSVWWMACWSKGAKVSGRCPQASRECDVLATSDGKQACHRPLHVKIFLY